MSKVLLADDSATMQKVVDLVLREQGYEVVSANNGQEAMTHISATPPPALVLAYIKLPGLDGYKLCQQIKTSPATQGIPVILLAGAFDPVDESMKAKVGANDTLVKPFQAEELLKKIQALIGSAAPEAAAAAGGDEIMFEGEDAGMSFAGVAEAEETVVMEPAEAEAVMAEAVEAEPVEAAAVDETVLMEPAAAEAVMAEAVEAGPVMAEPVMEEAPAAAPAAAPVQSAAGLEGAGIEAAVRQAVEAKVTEAMAAIDLRDLILKALEPHAKEALEKIAYDAVPEFLDRTLRGTITESLGAVNKELENIIWETVPQLADTMLKKEMERIRQETQ
jgi:DNA-binding response OmpR family regulator